MKLYTCAIIGAFLFVSIPVDLVNGEEEGAPTEACLAMTPAHGNDSQDLSSSPFRTEIPAGGYALVGKTVKLELTTKNKLIPFKGFLVMAFDETNDTKPIGTFTLPSDGKLINCTEGFENAATHQWHNDKQLVTIEWIPPTTEYNGTVIFRTTFVQSFTIYWVKTESIPVSFVKEVPTTTTAKPTTPNSASQSSCTLAGLITLLLAFLMR